MILVAGATGQLGTLIAQQLVASGKSVRALVRTTADPEKVAGLQRAGIELAVGDLKDRESLARACANVSTVISSATSIVSRQADDDLNTVDREGNIALFEIAQSLGARHSVFVSFHPHAVDFPLQDAKRAVEARLRASSIPYTILQPTFFMESWLGPALLPVHGFDFVKRQARIAGSGDAKLSWISINDVARFVTGAVENPRASRQEFVLGGPDALSPKEVMTLLERASGKAWQVEYFVEKVLGDAASAGNQFEQSFAALLTSFATGYVADTTAATSAIPFERYRVADYVERTLRYSER